ncbi:uncharacterized protein LOC109860825 [Pseudomyrmex gracilis]|uniref:uncharacterized protein LOC109860825 n=1 Tax=Pseudomyrmex gracilis TaxID=219809 RepID=UPI000995B690|nr:uncharacterized protein LOC109860825 [Pseudomyrmex gracilis]
MEKFVIDLDKVLNDFEFNEDCAEQTTSVTTCAIDASSNKDNRAAAPSKTRNFNSEKSVEIDVPLEKRKDTREKNVVSVSDNTDSINNLNTCVNDNTTEQKLYVYTQDPDQTSLMMYKDISCNLVQKQQNGSSDLKNDTRYDKKLNQSNFKPSISNVFSSLNEYINAPTGSLDYIEPILDKAENLPGTKKTNIAEDDSKLNETINILTGKCSAQEGKRIQVTDASDHASLDIIDKNALDYCLPLELPDTFVQVVEVDSKQDNAMQNNLMSQHSPQISLDRNNITNVVITASDTVVKQDSKNIIENTELFGNSRTRVINENATINDDTFKETSQTLADKQRQDAEAQDSVGATFVDETKTDSAVATNNKIEVNKETKTANNCNTLSNVYTMRANVGNFSEDELNRYLLELEMEVRSKVENTCLDKTAWTKLESLREKTVNERRDDEDANEAPIFEKIMIGELPKISDVEFHEKAKKFPVIDYNTDVCNEDVMDIQCSDARVISNETSNQLNDRQINKMIKSTKHNDANIASGYAVQENALTATLSVIDEDKSSVTSESKNVGEQCIRNINMMPKLQQNIHVDTHLENSNSSAVKTFPSNLSEKDDCNDKIYCRDLVENSKENVLAQHGARTRDNDTSSKTESTSKLTDSCVVHTSENNQEAGKPARPQTLNIVSTHKKDESHMFESSSAIPEGGPERSEGRSVVEEDRGASSDVSDNSLVEFNVVLGKQPPFWIPDSDAPSCMLCDTKFTVLKRRHHCRACGKVLCNKCCNMKYRLEYQITIDSRVCAPCYQLLTKAENEHGINDWSTNYSSYSGHNDINSPQGRQPNPNNPMEYCSTIPPLQQLAGGLPPPPTVMVPVGVLKREGSKHRTEGQKSVIFSDGIRPGCDLTELDTCWDPKPPYRKQGNKRVFMSGSTLTDTVMRKQSHPPLDSVTNSYIPHDSNLLPPTVTIHKGQVTYHPPMEEGLLYKTLKNECEPPVMFAINRNLYAYVKITNLNCCVNKICWNVTSRGLACVGQDEVILLVEVLPDETRIPKDLLIYINQLYLEAIKGNTMTELGFSIYQGGNLLGSREHKGFLFIRQTLQCLQKIILPPAPFLIALLVHRWETPWAKVFPLRLVLRLGAEYRYYPCPLVSVRFRDALYFEIGHTVMKVLADFRHFAYTLPIVRGLTIHLKNRTTDVMFPRNRYDQVIKGLNNSNDHVLAYASNFSITADSHLVCIQTNTGDESNYQTQAINIHNKPRTVTGASFIVINGALKSSMGLSAKSSIVEDGLMVEIMPEKMEALKAALKNMQDFSIGCGRQGASEPDETVNIKWVDNDVMFNIGVKSPIDGQLMDGIPSIRVHNGTDYKGTTRFIRWTEVFIIKSDDHSSGVNDPVDINKLSGNIAKATCTALVKLLDLLATAGLTKLGVRATIHPDNVGYEAGSEGTKLPPIYMKSLDNELIQVLHKAAQSSQDAHTVLELIFYILED